MRRKQSASKSNDCESKETEPPDTDHVDDAASKSTPSSKSENFKVSKTAKSVGSEHGGVVEEERRPVGLQHGGGFGHHPEQEGVEIEL